MKGFEMPQGVRNFIAVIICVVVAFGLGCGFQYNLDKSNLKPIIKEKEVIKVMETPRTDTWKFVQHLRPNCDPELCKVIGAAVDAASEKWNLPRKLLIAIMNNESAMDVNARSNVGAKGLMQVLPKFHKEKIAGRNLWHIGVNVDVGAQIFREYLDLEKGCVHKTFHRYLSKNATELQLTKYTSGIYKSWSELQMFDYIELGKEKEQFSLRLTRTDKLLVEPDHQMR